MKKGQAHLHWVLARSAPGDVRRVSEPRRSRLLFADGGPVAKRGRRAEECGVIQVNPVKKFRNLKESRKERRGFTEDQVRRVIDAVRPDCRPIFMFIKETGCRRAEALSLQHWQVQEESRLVVFSEDTKSRKYRYVPLTEAGLGAVKALPPLEDCPYVFYYRETRTRWRECRDAWEKAREAVNLPGLQVKDLRRHYAIELAENGADMHDIQQVPGHTSVATTERYYAQFSPRHSAKKILKVFEGGRSKRGSRQSQPETKRKHGRTPPLSVAKAK